MIFLISFCSCQLVLIRSTRTFPIPDTLSSSSGVSSITSSVSFPNDVIRDEAEDREVIYLPPYYFSESGCAKRLLWLMSCGKKKSEDTEEILEKVAASSEITYDEIQWQAVKTAVSSKVMVLTGGPGTGKTTTTLGIISASIPVASDILFAALPVGAARMF